ncbi:hypothetical protein SAMN05421664_2916 [Chryseobacterium soldanellicola]|uniref:Uncharacterized protein n=2 Tax=Chryseobacterium soldanellicola TaxID=311333 RepID=A0A1H1F7W0_9FLAO|nr:hypothetical protein SAMN05421664_2916 [Chryseobacterium soldanellicola]
MIIELKIKSNALCNVSHISYITKTKIDIMSKKYPLILLCLFIFCLNCSDKAKEQQIAKRELQLLDKEKSFAEKESDYQSLLRMRDSILSRKTDSVKLIKEWPPEVLGTWTGTVICTESNCTDYVIGDQRVDNWEFDNDSTPLVCKIINNNKLVRLYSGKYENGEVHLQYKTDSSADKSVEMNVVLNEISSTRIKGTRTVTIDNECLTKFNVELTRPSK